MRGSNSYHCALNVNELQCRFCPSLVAVKDRKIIGFSLKTESSGCVFAINSTLSICISCTSGDRKIIGFCQRQNQAAAFFAIVVASSITHSAPAVRCASGVNV